MEPVFESRKMMLLEVACLRMFLESRLNAIQFDHFVKARRLKGELEMRDHVQRVKELRKQRHAFCTFGGSKADEHERSVMMTRQI